MQNKKLFLSLLICMFAANLFARDTRPNILVIISDDHAYQAIGAYGAKFGASPQLDRLAKEGTVFENAFVTNSICGPSRAVFLTGKYSHINGFRDNFSSFNGSQPHFARHLTNAGYQTAWIGKWHLETQPQGFNYYKILPGQGEYYNPDFINMQNQKERHTGYVTNIITDFTIDYLNNRDPSKPFCVVVGEKATHRVWNPDTSDFDLFKNVVFPLPENFYDAYTHRKPAAVQTMNIRESMLMGYDLKMSNGEKFSHGGYGRMNPEQRAQFDAHYLAIEKELQRLNLQGNALVEWKFQQYMRDYLATAVSLDRNIGKIVDYIDSHGLRDNTVVIYTSDQGFYLGEHGWFDKRFMYEESFKTPLIIRYPKIIAPGSRKQEMVMNLDLAPTIMQLAGLPVPKDMQGQSLLPVFKNASVKQWRDKVYYHYFEWPNEHTVYPHFGVRNKRYKLIRFYKPELSWELYDLQKDRSEMKNVFTDPAYKNIVSSMKKELKTLIKKYRDTEAAKYLD